MKRLRLLIVMMLLCASSFALAGHAEPVEDGVVEEDEMTTEKTKPSDKGKVIDRTDVVRTAKDEDEASSEENGDQEAVTLPSATKKALVAKVGKTYGVSMDKGERQDFDFDLPKGQFMVYVDAQRIGEQSLTSSIDSSLKLLKRNGAAMSQYSGDLIYWNAHEKEYRVGKAFSFSKPTAVRFRLNNASNGENNFWLTVVPVAPFQFLPYGFGAKVMAAKIGPNNGAGGTLGSREFSYIRAKMPAGKWSVSLGAQQKEGRVYVTLNSLDERGLDYTGYFSILTSAGDYGSEAREEKIITLTKPRTFIFRVYNAGSSGSDDITYDVTIEPATD